MCVCVRVCVFVLFLDTLSPSHLTPLAVCLSAQTLGSPRGASLADEFHLIDQQVTMRHYAGPLAYLTV